MLSKAGTPKARLYTVYAGSAAVLRKRKSTCVYAANEGIAPAWSADSELKAAGLNALEMYRNVFVTLVAKRVQPPPSLHVQSAWLIYVGKKVFKMTLQDARGHVAIHVEHAVCSTVDVVEPIPGHIISDSAIP